MEGYGRGSEEDEELGDRVPGELLIMSNHWYNYEIVFFSHTLHR